MAMERQVFCIVREDSNDPKSAIYKIGGLDWGMTVDEADAAIKNNKYSFYVKDEKGKTVDVTVEGKNVGLRYFRTSPDKSKINKS